MSSRSLALCWRRNQENKVLTCPSNVRYIDIFDTETVFPGQENLYVNTSRMPFRNDANFIQYAKENSWQKRRDNETPWPWKTNVFDFIRETYGPWLGKGLVQADLRSVDRPLYNELHKRLALMTATEKEAMLAKLNLPTASEARLSEIEDPAERAQLEAVRSWWRAQKKLSPKP